MAISSDIEKLERRWLDNPTGLMFAPLAEAYRKAGEFVRALEILDTGLAKHPEYVPALIVRGRCHLDGSDLAKAESAFEEALTRDPVNAIALRGIAEVFERTGRIALAMERLRYLLEVDRGDLEARIALDRLNQAQSEAPHQAPRVPSMSPMVATASPAPAPAEPAGSGMDSAVADQLEAPAEPAAELADGAAAEVASPEAEPAVAEAGVGSGVASVEPESSGSERVGSDPTPAPEAELDPLEEEDEEYDDLSDDDPVAGAPVDAGDDEILKQEGVADQWADAVESGTEVGISEEERLASSFSESWSVWAGWAESGTASGQADQKEAAGAPSGEEAGGTTPEAAPSEPVAEPPGAIMPFFSSWRNDDSDRGPAEAGVGPESSGSKPAEPPAEATGAGGGEAVDERPGPEVGSDSADRPASGEPSEPEPVSVEELEPDAPPEVPAVAASGWMAADPPIPRNEPEPATTMQRPFEEDQPLNAAAVSEHREPDVAGEAAEEPELIATESMAALFLKQGHRDLALAVYRQLVARYPGNDQLRETMAGLELESAPAASAGARRYAAAHTGGESVVSFLRSVLDAPPPAGAATVLPPAMDRGPAGEPTHPSDQPLSLASVFGKPDAGPPPVAGVERRAPAAERDPEPDGATEPSYDEFFGDAADQESAPAAGSAARPSDAEDLRQFNEWLKGLKR